jgi:polar amino acid transport system substrate-binding protein
MPVAGVIVLFLVACSGPNTPSAIAPNPQPSPSITAIPTPLAALVAAARADLAPTGKLRVAVNYGNGANATRDAASGEMRGVAVDLGRELAASLGLPLELLPYASGPAAMTALVRAGAWEIYFSDSVPPGNPDATDDAPPHVQVDNTYVVAASSPLRSVAEVDRPGIRIAVARDNNADKYLTSERPLRSATLVRAETPEEARQLLVDGKVDALATGRNVMPQGFRALDDNLFVAGLAVAVRKGRAAGLAYVSAFLEQAKTSGLIAQAIGRAGLTGVHPAPPAPR